MGLSAGGPLSSTEVESSGLRSKPKDSGGWDLCFGASCSTHHCGNICKKKKKNTTATVNDFPNTELVPDYSKDADELMSMCETFLPLDQARGSE